MFKVKAVFTIQDLVYEMIFVIVLQGIYVATLKRLAQKIVQRCTFLGKMPTSL